MSKTFHKDCFVQYVVYNRIQLMSIKGGLIAEEIVIKH